MKKIHIFLLLVIFCLSGFLSLDHLTNSPPPWYDEGMILQAAQHLSTEGSLGIQLAPDVSISARSISTGFPVTVPVSASFALFGVGMLQARIIAVGYIFLLLVAGILLTRKLFGTPAALWGGLLVTTFSSLYGNGKSVLGEVPGLALLLLFLYFFTKAEESDLKDTKYLLLSGLFLGLAVVTKPIFILLIPAFVFAFVLSRGFSCTISALARFGAGALVPLGIWLFTQFGVGDTLATVIQFYVNPYQVSNLAEVVTRNMWRFVLEATPLYTFVTFLVWMGSLLVRLYKRRKVSVAEWCAFFFSFLIMLAFLRTPGWYRYLFPANIVILFFLPYAIKNIFSELVVPFTRLQKYATYVPVVLLSLLIALQGYHFMFNSWIGWVSKNNITEELEGYFSRLDTQKSVFVFNTPEIVPFLKTKKYYQYISAGGGPLISDEDSIWVMGSAYLETLKAGTPDVLILSDSLVAGLDSYTQKYKKTTTIGRYLILEK